MTPSRKRVNSLRRLRVFCLDSRLCSRGSHKHAAGAGGSVQEPGGTACVCVFFCAFQSLILYLNKAARVFFFLSFFLRYCKTRKARDSHMCLFWLRKWNLYSKSWSVGGPGWGRGVWILVKHCHYLCLGPSHLEMWR